MHNSRKKIKKSRRVPMLVRLNNQVFGFCSNKMCDIIIWVVDILRLMVYWNTQELFSIWDYSSAFILKNSLSASICLSRLKTNLK